MKNGPIVMVEDDGDDKEMLEEALLEIGVKNEVVWFTNSIDALAYLTETTDRPFLIFCDINLPKQKGTDFKSQIDSDPQLRKKSIPFLFYSTSADQATVDKAYCEMTIQGFFKKPSSFEEIKKDMKVITDYWLCCRHPNML